MGWLFMLAVIIAVVAILYGFVKVNQSDLDQ